MQPSPSDFSLVEKVVQVLFNQLESAAKQIQSKRETGRNFVVFVSATFGYRLTTTNQINGSYTQRQLAKSV